MGDMAVVVGLLSDAIHTHTHTHTPVHMELKAVEVAWLVFQTKGTIPHS